MQVVSQRNTMEIWSFQFEKCFVFVFHSINLLGAVVCFTNMQKWHNPNIHHRFKHRECHTITLSQTPRIFLIRFIYDMNAPSNYDSRHSFDTIISKVRKKTRDDIEIPCFGLSQPIHAVLCKFIALTTLNNYMKVCQRVNKNNGNWIHIWFYGKLEQKRSASFLYRAELCWRIRQHCVILWCSTFLSFIHATGRHKK